MKLYLEQMLWANVLFDTVTLNIYIHFLSQKTVQICQITKCKIKWQFNRLTFYLMKK